MNNTDLHALASKWFADAGKTYGDEPYSVHLKEVKEELGQAGFELKDEPELYDSVDLHDVFEDIKHITPGYVLSLGVSQGAVCTALLVTDEDGATRKERKANTYPLIASTRNSLILKLADRLANVRRAGKIETYRSEHPSFYEALYPATAKLRLLDKDVARIEIMWIALDNLLYPEKANQLKQLGS